MTQETTLDDGANGGPDVGVDQVQGAELGITVESNPTPDSSLVLSLRLHLLSEHDNLPALTMDLADVEFLHAELHEHDGDDSDLSFRPFVAQSQLLRQQALRDEAVLAPLRARR